MAVVENKRDMLADPDRAEMADLIELATGALLDAQGYTNTPFVFGSVLKALASAQRRDLSSADVAYVTNLVAATDRHFPTLCGTMTARS